MTLAFILFILIFLLGYLIGRHDKPEEYLMTRGTLTKEKMAELYQRAICEDLPTGQIKPKTAKEIQDRSLPDKIREGRQAMKETLDSHPELVARRKLIEQYKKEGRPL